MMIGINKGVARLQHTLIQSAHLRALLFDRTELSTASGLGSKFYFPNLCPEEFCIPSVFLLSHRCPRFAEIDKKQPKSSLSAAST